MIAWPIETSSVHGMFLTKYSRFSRLRSCPALRPSPHSLAASAALMKGAIACSGQFGNASAYDSVYNSTLSAPHKAAPSAISGFGSMNIDVLMPLSLKVLHTSVRKSLCLIVSQPALDVMASSASGTRVTWAGHVSRTRSMNEGIGFPSILNSVVMSNAFSSESFAVCCCLCNVRHIASAGVSYCGNLVYVDAEFGHSCQ